MPIKPAHTIRKSTVLTVALGLFAIPVLTACGPTKPADDATDKKPAKVGKVIFGEAVSKVDPKTNKGIALKLLKPRNDFKANTPFAYLALAEEPFKTSTLNVVWSSYSPGGESSVMLQQEIKVEKPDEHHNAAADWDEAKEIMEDWAAGKYKVQVLRGTAVMAEGVFTYGGS